MKHLDDCITGTDFDNGGNKFLAFDNSTKTVRVDGSQTGALSGQFAYIVTINDDYEFR